MPVLHAVTTGGRATNQTPGGGSRAGANDQTYHQTNRPNRPPPLLGPTAPHAKTRKTNDQTGTAHQSRSPLPIPCPSPSTVRAGTRHRSTTRLPRQRARAVIRPGGRCGVAAPIRRCGEHDPHGPLVSLDRLTRDQAVRLKADNRQGQQPHRPRSPSSNVPITPGGCLPSQTGSAPAHGRCALTATWRPPDSQASSAGACGRRQPPRP